MPSVLVRIEMPEPVREERARPKSPKVSVEERVRDALECIESGHDSSVDWQFINKTYKQLCSLKQTPRVANLKKMIEPVLAHYGYHKVTTEGKK